MHADTPGRRISLARSVLLSPRFGWEKTWNPSHSTFGFLLLPLDARIPSSIKHLRNAFVCMVSKTGPIVRHPSLVLMELLGDTCSLNSLPSQRPCLWLVSSSPKVILEGTVSWPTLLPMACTIASNVYNVCESYCRFPDYCTYAMLTPTTLKAGESISTLRSLYLRMT